MEKIASVEQARLLGSLAYAKGVTCSPCLDASMMQMLEGRKVGDPRNMAELKAWHKGWMEANLAA